MQCAGADSPAIREGRAFGVQALSGTGALRHATHNFVIESPLNKGLISKEYAIENTELINTTNSIAFSLRIFALARNPSFIAHCVAGVYALVYCPRILLVLPFLYGDINRKKK